MKVTDLRIGNLVDFKGMEFIVRDIQEDAISCQYNKKYPDYGLDDIEIEHFQGIPLTEEWLKKFGFEYERQTIGGWERWEYKDGRHHIKILDKKFSWGVGEYSKHIQFVHQLQNLIHALTGSDLTLKE